MARDDEAGAYVNISLQILFALVRGKKSSERAHSAPFSNRTNLNLQKNTAMKKIFITLVGSLTYSSLPAQTIVYSDNFSASQGASYTTSGAIGTSEWTVARSGDDWGARIDGGMMTLNNTATDVARANGWVYSYLSLASTNNFNTTFSDSAGLMTWTFNMRQIRTNPAGFTSISYGAAYIIGASSTTVATNGFGYAVVLGNTSTPDPLRLVSFTNGIQTIGTSTTALITATNPLANPTNNYMSIRLTYDPASHLWELSGRDDGTSAFSDPNTGILTSLGSASNSLYTSLNLTSSGAYWQGSTAADQTAFFDNVSLTVVPEPSIYALLVLSGLGLAGCAVRRRCRS